MRSKLTRAEFYALQEALGALNSLECAADQTRADFLAGDAVDDLLGAAASDAATKVSDVLDATEKEYRSPLLIIPSELYTPSGEEVYERTAVAWQEEDFVSMRIIYKDGDTGQAFSVHDWEEANAIARALVMVRE